MNQEQAMSQAAYVCDELYRRGWTEAIGGNVSLRMECGGTLVTVSGCRIADVSSDPQRCLGVVDSQGEVVSGFAGGGCPTSELGSHLTTLNMLEADGRCERAMLHCHPPAILALGVTLGEMTGEALTELLWSMHTECGLIFPRGVGALGAMVPGSEELGAKTAEQFKTRDLVFWPHHGLAAIGKTLVEAYDRIDMAEKAAGIALAALQASGINSKLPEAIVNATRAMAK
ncbi:MAG: hypothetical protein HN909_06945 [Phycisphaerales bacterium]|jgi:rhamnulose-1-phosphate aldolase|nr:hypothetical protein [Phycisphaerales bacterium]MBT7171488.1 hypothetical protein [Phycisphaerales bacterium]